MFYRKTILAAAAVLSLAGPAAAEAIEIHDPYLWTAGPMARTAAAYMHIVNQSDAADRLIAVSSDLAKRVELHSSNETSDGVMQMIHLEDGIAIPAGSAHALARGGDHVMFMGLTRKVAQGDSVLVTLNFEVAGEITVEVPVDLERPPVQDMHHQDMDGDEMHPDEMHGEMPIDNNN